MGPVWVALAAAPAALIAWLLTRDPRAAALSAGGCCAMAAWGLLAGPTGGDAVFWVVTAVYAGFLAALAGIDAATGFVPDILSAPFVLSGMLYALVVLDAVVAHGLTGVGCALCLWIFGRMLARPGAPSAVGGGDVVILAGLGAWLGPHGALEALLAATLTAAAAGLAALLARRDGALPFAPSLMLGGWIAWLHGGL